MRFAVSLIAASAAISVTACGQADGSGGSCSAVVGCGGELSGVWEIVDICFTDGYPDPSLEANCAGTQLEIRDYVANGTFDFRDDGTYVIDASAEVTQSVRLPKSCFENSELQSCEEFEAGLRELLGPSGCRDSGSSCDCLSEFEVDLADIGSWSTEGSELVIESTASAGPVRERYCVEDLGLTLSARPGGAAATFSMVPVD